MAMKLNTAGLTLIKQSEGLVLTAYKASADETNYTIGYGHCSADIHKGQTITEAQAEAYLIQDLAWAEAAVNKYAVSKFPSMTSNQFSALVSYTFNRGTKGLMQLVNNSRSLSAMSANIVIYWGSNQSAKDGLIKRRYREQALFNNGAHYSEITISNITTDSTANSGTTNNKSGAVSKAKASEYQLTYKTVTSQVTHDIIKTHDVGELSQVSGTSLLSSPTLVEVPFVIVDIGGVTFGSYSKTSKAVQFPNYVTSLQITKVNGEVNSYVLKLTYLVAQGQDPNFIDKVLSSVGYGEISISYGDWSIPSYIYEDEKALITNVSTTVDFSSNKLEYTISAVSTCFPLIASSFTFSKQKAKPSTVIKNLLFGAKSSTYGLAKAFPGLTKKNFSKYIATDDAAVELDEKTQTDPLTYLNYLVSSMIPSTSASGSTLVDAVYALSIQDGTAENGATYFTVTKVAAAGKSALATSGVYTVDVGYPTESPVMGFTVDDDQSWSLLYQYSESLSHETHAYSIDNSGKLISTSSPGLTTSSTQNYTTASARSWWTSMTQFPIKATLTIKGLLRPALLCSYVKINAYMHGQKHVSSGLYIVTKQVDSISAGGYTTSLSLTRVAGDTDTITSTTETVTAKIPIWKKVN